jgi:hypothetical protein
MIINRAEFRAVSNPVLRLSHLEEERGEATEAAMDAVIGEQRHVFVPLGFEANGAYGAATRHFFRVIERAVEAAAERDQACMGSRNLLQMAEFDGFSQICKT